MEEVPSMHQQWLMTLVSIFLKKQKKKPFNIISLSDNNAISTAISNDIGFDNIFLSQIQMHYKKNDIIIVMSV